jgi:hypothetical protein
MVGVDGQPANVRWPIHDYADCLNVEFCIPDRGEVIRWLTAFLPFTILGSSASNLYRTKILQKYPFHLNFGHGGDAALGLQIAPFAKLGITRKVLSTFVAHGPGRDISAAEQVGTAKKFLTLLDEVGVTCAREVMSSVAISRALLEKKIKMLEWIAGLEPLADVVREQKCYIDILEKEKSILLEERKTLSCLSAGLPVPFLKSGHLLSLKRFLKRNIKI